MILFNRGDECWYMHRNMVYHGIVVGTLELDELNRKYLVWIKGTNERNWIIDTILYHSLKDLFDSLKGIIVE